MKRKRYTEPQIASSLQQVEAGAPVDELCRKSQICEVICGRLTAAHGGATMNRFLTR